MSCSRSGWSTTGLGGLLLNALVACSNGPEQGTQTPTASPTATGSAAPVGAGIAGTTVSPIAGAIAAGTAAPATGGQQGAVGPTAGAGPAAMLDAGSAPVPMIDGGPMAADPPRSTCPATSTLGSGNTDDSIDVEGTRRTYVVHVPPSYTGTTALPLLVVRLALDWIVAENERPCSQYYRNVQVERTAAMGQSCGGLMTFGVSSDPRLTLFDDAGPEGQQMFVGANCGLCATDWDIRKKNME